MHHSNRLNIHLFVRSFLGLFILLFFPSAQRLTGEGHTERLKDRYKGYFPMGVAVRPTDLSGETATLIQDQFNSITAENAMKMGPIHPREDRYFWKDADSIVHFAMAHHMKIRGHTLCWHNQAPDWLFQDMSGKDVSKEVLLKRLEQHIKTVVGRYKGRIYAWDVVNEAIADDSTFLRKSKWFEITGADFIAKAFEYAHEADSEAILFYNDYNTEIPAKREKIYRLLKSLLDRGVPVHGIGLQAHWSINSPSRKQLEKSIQQFSSLGLQVQFTELDISVYDGHEGGQLSRNRQQPLQAIFTPEMEQQQLEQYKMVFDVFRRYKKSISGVTFWNVSDRYTWLDSRGKKNYPLLFDQHLQPKKAFWEVVHF